MWSIISPSICERPQQNVPVDYHAIHTLAVANGDLCFAGSNSAESYDKQVGYRGSFGRESSAPYVNSIVNLAERVSRSLGSSSMNKMVASLRNLQLGKVSSLPTLIPGMFKSGCPVCNSLHVDPCSDPSSVAYFQLRPEFRLVLQL
ncbi:hypothetical protein M0R45_002865 [Rubus argutus]|uniref:Uncharacterized protein n=1 Tax=Rubus argutus TaxID=59490 RepID=A0AAW1VRB7_RUBAR